MKSKSKVKKHVIREMKIDGLPVIDAKEPVTVHVTNIDVKRGKSNDPARCAFAQACVHDLECDEARVHMGRVYLRFGKKWVRYQTPGSIRSEVIAFDRRHSFKAGEYMIRPVCPAEIKLRGKQAGSKRNQTNPLRDKSAPKKRAPYHLVEGVRVRMQPFGE